MSRPICQVFGCEKPASCFVDIAIPGGHTARLRVCEDDAMEQGRRAQDVFLDVQLQLARKRT